LELLVSKEQEDQMGRHLAIALAIAAGWLLGASNSALAQGCTQTISPGTNLANAISNAAAGSTICLNPGSYGSVSLNSVGKNPRVTVRSTTGLAASFGLSTTNGTNGLTFDGVTLTGWNRSGATTRDITVKNCRFTSQAALDMTGASNTNTLIDNCTFINISAGGKEGRLAIWQTPLGNQPVGVTVKNSLFENLPPYDVGESDGIEIGAYGVVIGPGNIIRGIQQGNFQRHVDGIQGYGQSHTVITGNYFRDNDVNLGFYDGGNTETITHNVFERGVGGSGNNVFLSIGPNGTITHNTFKVSSVGHGAKAGDTPNSNHLWQDNIFVGANFYNYNDQGNGSCSGCAYNNNLFYNGTPRGTNQIIGAPSFVGGTNPSTWEGFRLASGSLGSGDAANPPGTDVGSNLFGSTQNSAPAAPTFLSLQ
jgi:hypothetical protein